MTLLETRPLGALGPAPRVRIVPPKVMLIGLAAGEEPPALGLEERVVEIVRVRFARPACVRIRVLRPHVVVVGPGVKPHHLPELVRASRDGTAEIVDLSVVRGQKLRAAMSNALQSALARRRVAGRPERQRKPV